MPPKGSFRSDDPAELLEFIERKLLKRGFAAKFLARFDAVYVRPHGGDTSAAVRIGKPGLLSKDVGVLVSPPEDMERDTVSRRLEAAGVRGPEARRSFGQTIYDFPDTTPASELVDFALAALGAFDAKPADDRWEWEASRPSPE